MEFIVDGQKAYVSNGGHAHVAGQKWAVFIHGAGLNHTVWAAQSRWLAFRRRNVLSVDLPGHGQSGGALLPDIPAMGAWIHRLLDAVGATSAALKIGRAHV